MRQPELPHQFHFILPKTVMSIKNNFAFPYSLHLLSKRTAPKINIIPQTDAMVSGSENSTTLKIVADIGSIIPSADAVPTSKFFNDTVYKK